MGSKNKSLGKTDLLEINIKCSLGYDSHVSPKFITFLFIVFLTKCVLIFKACDEHSEMKIFSILIAFACNESLEMKIFSIFSLHLHTW